MAIDPTTETNLKETIEQVNNDGQQVKNVSIDQQITADKYIRKNKRSSLFTSYLKVSPGTTAQHD